MSVRSLTGKSITVQTAEIKSATVEIKTLAVNNKQVTLATFRQIPQERLIDGRTITLRGVVWGRVNYFWEAVDTDPTYFFGNPPTFYQEYDYDRSGQAVHVLWQLGTELRRDVVYYRRNSKENAFSQLHNWCSVDFFKTWQTKLKLIGECHGVDWHYLYVNAKDFEEVTGLDAMEILPAPPKQIAEVHSPGEFRYFPSYGPEAAQREEYERQVRDYADYAKRLPQYHREMNDFARNAKALLLEMAKSHYHRYVAEITQHNALIDAIQQTDQLFIAV